MDVVVTSKDPNGVLPVWGTYKNCTRIIIEGRINTKHFTSRCPTPRMGRYVAIIESLTVDLYLCEFEVFGSRKCCSLCLVSPI